MMRKAHSKKEVEEALRHAEKSGWRIELGGAHQATAGPTDPDQENDDD